MIGKDKDRAIYNKLFKLCKEHKNPVCPHCKELITVNDATETDYIKTKEDQKYLYTVNVFINTGMMEVIK